MSKKPKPSQDSTDDIESEFSRLFWAARKEQTAREKAASANDPATKVAIDFADAQGLDWAKKLIHASRFERIGEYEKAHKLLTEIQPAIPGQWQGLLYYIRGTVFHGDGKLDEAITDYQRALDDPRYDRPGNAWFTIGHALSDKGELDAALKAYHNAFNDPNFDTPGDVWYSIGYDLSEKGEQTEAIKAYYKALNDPKYEEPGSAWHNIAVALSEKGDLEKAIKAYREALKEPKHRWAAKTWANLAQVYVEAGKPQDAETAFSHALSSPDPQGGDHARARLGLQILLSNITTQALSPDDRAMVDKPTASTAPATIEDSIIAAINEAGDTQYEKYLAKPNSKRDDTLSILRGWSSAVTLLEGSERRWRGGGYFLKWRGFGIVIDPGFDFLRNFHDAGYHGREIQAVVVSHNHPDHNSDLKDIDDLRYELYKRRAADKSVGGGLPYVLLWDQDTEHATKFAIEKPQHQHPPIVMPSGFPQSVNLAKHDAKVPVRVTPFKVNHGSDVQHAMGMMVELLDKKGKTALRIGYTADTAYFEDLHKHLEKCDILIAHISQPSIEELKDPSKFKDTHLGYRGTAKLLRECQPKLALIGEFWAGFTDLRIPLVKGLRLHSGLKNVLPAGLSMHLRLPSLDIECTECRKPTPFTDIKVAPPTDNFGSLAYLCPGCMIG
ncbi:tetratricopeptide repeat protein [Brevifollis gellanilyticus]|uniref:Metallo-beta-lactamase domain-containing protein n=1 Tax=Brevifollis gellanilyticus TaxID=748831 RepID=A0A512MI37_9BACT|nr:tetratricopeptide repeat protein [Brevifollis gellanilyticus]GEP46388.1 hypothetical protein BGE01nite_56790 [Brevifollis gellanilyticus]